MSTRSKEQLVISIRVSAKEYELYHSLTEKQRRKLRKLIRMIIMAAASEEDFSDILNISSEIRLSEDTKKFITEVLNNDTKRLAKEAVALLLTLKNMTKINPYLECREFIENNTLELKYLEEAYKHL